MKNKHIILGALLFLGSFASAQVNTQSQPSASINQENPFLDASGYMRSPNNIGKGLYFPKTDLTTWEFKTNLIDPGTFSTYFDGMIVYNSGTGNTIADATKGGKQVAVTPGFYYFKNPNQTAPTGSVANGEWVRLGADASAFDGEWVYDDATKRINLKRSGQATGFIDKVYYNSQTGQFVNIADENVRFTNYLGRERTLSNEGIYNFVQKNSKNLTALTSGTDRIKRMGENTFYVNETSPISNFSAQGNNYELRFLPTNKADTNWTYAFGTNAYKEDKATTAYLNGIINFAQVMDGDVSGYVNATRSETLIDTPSEITGEVVGTSTRITTGNRSGLLRKVIGVTNGILFGAENEIKEDAMIYSAYPSYGNFNPKVPRLIGYYYAGIGTATTNTGDLSNTKEHYGIYLENVDKAVKNYAIYSKAGKVRVGDLADTSATADRAVVVDKDGVLKTGSAANIPAVAIGSTTAMECNASNRGKMNFIPSTDNAKSDVFGICMRNKDGNYYWAYMVGGNNPTNGTGAFGSGL